MAEHDIEIVEGHVIAAVNEAKALIDTGSPVTFGRGPITWAGEDIDLPSASWAGEISDLEALAGMRFDLLIGGDVLQRAPLEIDPRSSLLRVGEHASFVSEDEVPIELTRNVPVAKGRLGGRPTHFALDTGAAVSFAGRDLLRVFPKVGNREDFYPGIGRFEAELFSAEVSLGAREAPLSIAALPDALQSLLATFGVEGIIGNDMLLRGGVRFDYLAKRLEFPSA